MTAFGLYFELGIGHILDVHGYDHILFVLALCAIYTINDWSKILVLVTAFTVGHSVTLALVALDILTINSSVVEFLIPVTIFLTALSNLKYYEPNARKRNININYWLALGFGLIHGMGFSNYFKSILGRESSVVQPLFAFNIGLEIGQIVIVLFYLCISFIFVQLLMVNRRYWSIITSSIIMGVAITMIMQHKF